MNWTEEIDTLKNVLNKIQNEKDLQHRAVGFWSVGKLLKEYLETPEFRASMQSLTRDLNEAIRDVSDSSSRLDSEVQKHNDLVNRHSQLLSRKTELTKQYDTVIEQKAEIDELMAKKEFLEQPENQPNHIKRELSLYSGSMMDLYQKHLECLESINKTLLESNGGIEKQLSEIIGNVKANLKALQNNQDALLKELDTTEVNSHLIEFTTELEIRKQEYNNKVQEIKGKALKIKEVVNELKDISENYDHIITSFRIHGLENETVFGALMEREGNGVLKYVQKLQEEIAKKLDEYDSEIRQLIEKRDQLPIYELPEFVKY